MSRAKPTLATIDAGGAAVIIAVTLGAYFLGIAPTRRAAAAAAEDASTLVARKAELAGLNDQVQARRETLKSQERKLQESDRLLRPRTDQYARFKEITELAQGVSLTLNENSPGKTVSGKRFDQTPIHISGTGSYPGFSDFLRKMHDKFADLQLVSFNLADHAQDRKNTPPHFDAEFVWYTIADPAAKPDAAAGGGDNGLSNPAAPPTAPPH